MLSKSLTLLIEEIKNGKTALGVGPMSKHCINATIELANDYKIPIILIASRRQVECKALGGGYVMDTESFAQYVTDKDVGGYVVLARDHGGPWQGDKESNLDHDEAINTAMTSYSADIKAGFDILHIDPSLKSRPMDEILADVSLLYEFCEQEAFDARREIMYEVGTEEHGGQITEVDAFSKFAQEMKRFPKVKFIVGNIGLHVQERYNSGKLNDFKARDFVQICNDNKLFLKCHNVDYVDYYQNNGSVNMLHNYRKVHSLNVAPQFGVQETQSLLYMWRANGFFKEADEFIDIAYNSGKWFKWMTNKGAVPSKEERALIAGHYVFNHPRVLQLRQVLNVNNLEDFVKDMVKGDIKEYLMNMGWSGHFGNQ